MDHKDFRDEYEEYEDLIDVIANRPMLAVTPSETDALNAALAQIRLPEPAAEKTSVQSASGLFGFVLASAAAFVMITVLLMRQNISFDNIRLSLDLLMVVKGLSSLLVVVFTTSFLPIVITARRRPLNGLTFRR